MNGIYHHSQATVRYIWQMLREYEVMDLAQINRVLKPYGRLGKNQRHQICKELYRQKYVNRYLEDGRTYFVRSAETKLTPGIFARLRCLWVLCGYLSRIESHHAPGAASIAMETKTRSYEILAVERGAERYCLSKMDDGGETRYIPVIEHEEQIPLLDHEKAYAYAIVGEKGQIAYYKREWEDVP